MLDLGTTTTVSFLDSGMDLVVILISNFVYGNSVIPIFHIFRSTLQFQKSPKRREKTCGNLPTEGLSALSRTQLGQLYRCNTRNKSQPYCALTFTGHKSGLNNITTSGSKNGENIDCPRPSRNPRTLLLPADREPRPAGSANS